jgi:hypothetical protein
MENTNENGIVPYTTTGFGGASSAKEAVIQEIASGNAKQNEMNQTVGGRGRGHPVNPDKKRGGKRSRKVGGKHSSKRSSKRSSHKRSRRGHPVNPVRKSGGKRSSNKRSSKSSSKRSSKSSSKRSSKKRGGKRSSHKRSSKRSSKRSRKIHGGEPQAGQEVTVPQFQGDPAASELSGGLNSLMLKSSQDAVHDKDISV